MSRFPHQTLLKKLLTAVVIVLIIVVTYAQRSPSPANRPVHDEASEVGGDALAQAIEKRLSDVSVEGQGVVVRLLPDDNDGSRHQKFVIRLDSGPTVLIAHNIDVAPRIPGLRKSDVVRFSGEYEWNIQGGVIHWTHRDPAGRHRDGWLRHDGKTYQ